MRAALLGMLLVCVGRESAATTDGAGPAGPNKTAEFMRRKQQLSHEVLDALILKEFKRIAKDANALVALAQAEEFQVHRTPRYDQHSKQFQDAARSLAKHARDENADGATLAFTEVVLSCVRCHDYIRQTRE